MADDVEGGAGRGAERQKGEAIGLVIGALIAASLVAFILQNTDKVRIEWFVWELDAPIWLVMLVTAAGAVVLARILLFVLRRRR